MSIRLDVTELATAISERDYARLLMVNDEGRAHAAAVTPTTAVMHRPATVPGEQPPGSCGADCLPVDLGTG